MIGVGVLLLAVAFATVDGATGAAVENGPEGRVLSVVPGGSELEPVRDWNSRRDVLDLTGFETLHTVKVLVTGPTSLELMLLDAAGGELELLEIEARDAAGRNLLLQRGAYGSGSNARVRIGESVDKVDLPKAAVIL